jgi:hypothetical protein
MSLEGERKIAESAMNLGPVCGGLKAAGAG